MSILHQPGVNNFIELGDVPHTYAGSGGKVVTIKASVDGLEFTTGGSGGGITIVTDSVSGVINSVNVTFTVPQVIAYPIMLVLANTDYQYLTDYTVAGSTITMTVAPDISLVGQPFFLVYASSSTSAIYTETVSGTINSVNQAFTVPTTITTPILLVLANGTYQEGVDYTTSGTNITMIVPPDISLAGQQFFFVHT